MLTLTKQRRWVCITVPLRSALLIAMQSSFIGSPSAPSLTSMVSDVIFEYTDWICGWVKHVHHRFSTLPSAHAHMGAALVSGERTVVDSDSARAREARQASRSVAAVAAARQHGPIRHPVRRGNVMGWGVGCNKRTAFTHPSPSMCPRNARAACSACAPAPVAAAAPPPSQRRPWPLP